jgi:predicted metal-dependent phosphotriesterase family hydrolase
MKTVALTWARMNPPTTGHMQLIKTLDEQEADAHLIYLSHSQGKEKDPLDYEQKIFYAKKFFETVFADVDVVQSSAERLVDVMRELQKYDKVILVVGGDRVKPFTDLLNRYNGAPTKAGSIIYSFTEIEVVSAGERDPESEDVAGMSASKLRAFVLEDDYTSFAAGVPTNDVSLKQKLFTDLRAAMLS